MENIDIAIIGTGPAGLVALKNLREQGFNAVAFERRESVGGLWAYSDNTDYTTALNDTTVNVSKFVFQITRHFRLVDKCNNTLKLTRHISIFTSTSDLESQYTGFCETLQILDGTFIIRILMASLYKKNDLEAKRVMVVGIGNTGCDIAMSLCKHASKTYLAYRRGRFVVSRYENSGVPTDSQIPWPVLRLKYLVDYYLPTLSKWATDKFMTNKMINDSAKHEPDDGKISRRQRLRIAEKRIRGEWRLVPCPSMAHRNPAAQEDIFPAFHNKDIIPMQGFVDFAGEDTVLLADGTTVEVDVVIFATGYRHDFSIMPELEMNGAAGMGLQIAKTTEKEQTPEDKEQGPSLPRLYQMIFPPKRATSIAFLSWLAPQEAVWCVSELASMAVAQAWVADFALKQNHNLPTPYQPSSILPTEKEMEADVDLYHTWWRKEWKTDHSMMEGYICKRIIAFKETCLDTDSKSYVLAKSGGINNNPEHSNVGTLEILDLLKNMTHGFIIEFRNDAHRVYFLNVDVAYKVMMLKTYKEVFEHIDPNNNDFLTLDFTDGVYGPSLMQ
ncbi:hypothetical protein FAUST_6503 [Fusarium austroamericanum]|uniref:Uncharacterized protein n=1 Tax=Fusarium austroamericanum TaxID=282268 RepID=A0AAN6BZK3_FUSAU|nr:hypothetical protein FAUST_6503 [Fusarium austroamericanum]